MNISDFITSELRTIEKKIAEISFAYYFEPSINYHTIVVSPENAFENNEEYMNLESELISEFEGAFPNDDILFASETPRMSSFEIRYVTTESFKIKSNNSMRIDSTPRISHNFNAMNDCFTKPYYLAA